MKEERAAYEEFASVYDMFMEEIPYKKWLANITQRLQKEGVHNGLVLELGCGTGTFTELMAGSGYDMIGVDSSMEMLEQALEKKAESGYDILYLQQDMREFELYGTVKAVVSVCDSMNYILTEKDLEQVFACVNNYLDPGGLFLFDLKTIHYFRDVCGDCVLADSREEGSFIWENSWFEEEQINEYDLTLFIREKSGLYRREQELHDQRGYKIDTVRQILMQAGMEWVSALDADTMKEATESSERIYIMAREKGKKNKIENRKDDRNV